MAAHVAAERDQFDCSTCRWGRHCDSSNPAPFAKFVIQIDGKPFLESRTCFLPMITPESGRFMRLHWHYKNRFLPHAGGICDQSNLYVEAMEVIEQTFNKIEADHLKREREKK